MIELRMLVNRKESILNLPTKRSELSFQDLAKLYELYELFPDKESILLSFIRYFLPKKVIDQLDKEDEHYIGSILSDLVEVLFPILQKEDEIFGQWSLEIDAMRLLGPDPEFNYIKVSEYGLAENLIRSYSETSDIKFLYELIATLFRPSYTQEEILQQGRTFSGDERLPYFAIETEKIKQLLIKKIDKHHCYAFLEYYTVNHKLNFETAYPYVFKKPTDKNEIDIPQNDYGVAGLVLEMAGAKWGTVKNVYEEFIHSIFIDANRTIEANEEKKLELLLQ